jgi:Uma2 family endonuclease
MTMSILRPPQAIVYPESDGEPMAENTLQYRWITTIREGVEGLFPPPAEVFTAADLFWYPVEGHPEIVQAPDVLVAFGRPKGDRGSYMQWLEGGIAPQVLFEILSPGNREPQMRAKLRFYRKYGCQEYYIYDPDAVKLTGHVRTGGRLSLIRKMHGWTSPLLGIRFDLSGSELTIYGPDGKRFLTWQENIDEKKQIARERDQIAQERDAERQRAERLAAQLRALGIEPID